MKIICESCSAKYSIADEKVHKRRVKIRCKKCGATIVVKGQDYAPSRTASEAAARAADPADEAAQQAHAPQDDWNGGEWTVALDDGSQLGGTVADMVELFRSERIHAECYVWREGMADWQPLCETPELWNQLLAEGLDQGETQQLGKAFLAPTEPAVYTPHPPQEAARAGFREDEPDIFGAHHGSVSPGGSTSESTGESTTEEIATSAPSDIPAKPPGQRFTAARGENSVLFTIDAIMGAGKPRLNKPPPSSPSSEKVDIAAIATSLPAPSISDRPGDGGLDFVAQLSQPPISALAAPLLPTSIEPDPPPRSVGRGADSSSPQKSNKRLIGGLGLVLVLVVLGGVAFGLGLFGNGKATVAKNDASDTIQPDPRAAAGEATKKTEALGDKINNKSEGTDNKADNTEGGHVDTLAVLDGADSNQDFSEVGEPAGPSGAKHASAKAVGPSAKAADTAGQTDGTMAAAAIAEPAEPTTATTPAKPQAPAAAAAPATPAAPAATTAAPATAKEPGTFDRSAANSALTVAANSAGACNRPGGPVGMSRASVTFSQSGKVSSVAVSGPVAGSPIESCVMAAFRRASVPPFKGSSVTVQKSFSTN